MADYLSELREVIWRGEGSSLKRDMRLRELKKFERRLKENGVDLGKVSQAEFCKALTGADGKEWMFRLCAARLLRGDFSDWTGWEYRNQWAIDSYRPDLLNKRWRLEPIRTLAILGEQGVGDEMMFSSCVPDVQKMGIEVTVECDPRLVEIFSRSFGCKTKPRDDIVNRLNSKYLVMKRDEDAFIPIGDLPRLFRKSRSDFPGVQYLKALPEKVERWSHLKGKTGLAWRGRRGAFKPAEMMKAAGLTEAVALQYDAWAYEVEGLIDPPCDTRHDLEDMLGICANLERVVTVPQTVVHLAGAQGVQVEVIIPPVKSGRVADQVNWRYGKGGRSMPWYRSVQVFNSLSEYKYSR